MANITPVNISPAVVKDTLEKPVLTNPPIDNGWSIKTSSSNIPSDGNGNGNILPNGSNGDILPSDSTGDNDHGIINLDMGEATTLTAKVKKRELEFNNFFFSTFSQCCSRNMVHCCKKDSKSCETNREEDCSLSLKEAQSQLSEKCFLPSKLHESRDNPLHLYVQPKKSPLKLNGTTAMTNLINIYVPTCHLWTLT